MSPFGEGGGAYATCYCLCATPPAPSVALIPSISPVIACLSCRDLYSPSLPFRSDLFLPSPTHSFPFAFGKLLLPSPQSCVYAVQQKHTQSVFTHTPSQPKHAAAVAQQWAEAAALHPLARLTGCALSRAGIVIGLPNVRLVPFLQLSAVL